MSAKYGIRAEDIKIKWNFGVCIVDISEKASRKIRNTQQWRQFLLKGIEAVLRRKQDMIATFREKDEHVLPDRIAIIHKSSVKYVTIPRHMQKPIKPKSLTLPMYRLGDYYKVDRPDVY